MKKGNHGKAIVFQEDTIDEVISRLQNRPLGRPYLFAWQIGNAGNVNYELLFDSIIAVRE